MDLFKIITLVLLIVLFYKVFLMDNTENFESTTTPTLIDDWNAINQLAQLSKKLMAGGLTVPGTLTSSGINTTDLVAKTISMNGTDLQKTLTTFNDTINKKFSEFETKLNNSIAEANNKIASGLSTAIKQDDSVRLYQRSCDWSPGNLGNGNALGTGLGLANYVVAGYGSTWRIARS